MARATLAWVLLFAAAAATAAVGDPVTGSWSLDARGRGDQVRLSLSRSWHRDGSRGSWSHSSDVDRSQIRGLSGVRWSGPVSLDLVREAGTIHLEGRMSGGRGSGRFTFEPDRGFVADLERAGLGVARESDLIRLCVAGLGREWIRDARALGLRRLSIEGLLRLQDNGVSPGFVRELGAAGYDGLSVEEVIRLRVNGVTPEYVRALGARPGRRPSIEEVVRFRTNGVEAGYVAALAEEFGPEEILRFHSNGIDAGYVAALAKDFGSEDILRLHNNGVSSGYVRDFRALGYDAVGANDLIRLRNNDVSAAFARRALRLHGRVTTEELIKLRVNGLE